MNNKEKVLTMLGFAQKCGKLVSGESAVKAMSNKGLIHLLILAEDLGDNRKDFWKRVAERENIPVMIFGNKRELGLAVGLSPRALIGIIDRQMAQSIK